MADRASSKRKFEVSSAPSIKRKNFPKVRNFEILSVD